MFASIPVRIALPFVPIPRGSWEGSCLPGLIPVLPRHNQQMLMECPTCWPLQVEQGAKGRTACSVSVSLRCGGRCGGSTFGRRRAQAPQTVGLQELTQQEDDGRLSWVYWFPRAAVTKYHNLGGLNHRNVLPYSLEAGSLRSRSRQIQCLVRACCLFQRWRSLAVTSHGEDACWLILFVRAPPS